MGLMSAQFHWTEARYWNATLHEIMATIEAWEAINSNDDD